MAVVDNPFGIRAFIFHHTGGRGTVAGVQDTLRQRGLGVQYIMDRDGNITKVSDQPGLSQIMPGRGVGTGLSNANTVGMEVIARDNGDVTPAQVAAAQRFIQQNYPNTPIYGHGEVNPGHKEADEGMAIVGAIRQARGQPVAPMAYADRGTPVPPSPIPQQPATAPDAAAAAAMGPWAGSSPIHPGMLAGSDMGAPMGLLSAAGGPPVGAPAPAAAPPPPLAPPTGGQLQAAALGVPFALLGQPMNPTDLANWYARQAPQG